MGDKHNGWNFVTAGTERDANSVEEIMIELNRAGYDGAVSIDSSTEASLQMDSAPASPADATTVYVSLFQTNTVALRAERFANWKRVGASVKYLTAAAYPAPAGAMADEPPTTRGGKG